MEGIQLNPFLNAHNNFVNYRRRDTSRAASPRKEVPISRKHKLMSFSLSRRSRTSKRGTQTAFSFEENKVRSRLRKDHKIIYGSSPSRKSRRSPFKAKRATMRISENIKLLSEMIDSTKRKNFTNLKEEEVDEETKMKRHKARITNEIKKGYRMGDMDYRSEWLNANNGHDHNWKMIKRSSARCYRRWKATQSNSIRERMSVPKVVDLNNSFRRDRFKYRELNMRRNVSLNDIELENFKKMESLTNPNSQSYDENRFKTAKKKRAGGVGRTMGGSTGKYMEDVSINDIDDVDPELLEQILVPKFEKLGLLHILKKKMVHFRFKHTQKKLNFIHRKRTFYIPRSSLVKRTGVFKRFSKELHLKKFLKKIAERKDMFANMDEEKEPHAPVDWKSDKIARKKKLLERRNQYFKITYNDPIIPDSVFHSSYYLKAKRKNFIKDIHHVVNEFFSNPKMRRKKDMNRLMATWLGSIKEFSDFPENFLSKVIKSMEMIKVNNRYLTDSGEKCDKLYILIEGSARIMNDDESCPLVKPVYVINGDIVKAVTAIPSENSIFVFEESKFLKLELKTFLELKKLYKPKAKGIKGFLES